MKLFLGQCNVEITDINPILRKVHLVVHINHPRADVVAKAPYVMEDIEKRHKAACDYLKSEGFLTEEQATWETQTGVICLGPGEKPTL